MVFFPSEAAFAKAANPASGTKSKGHPKGCPFAFGIGYGFERKVQEKYLNGIFPFRGRLRKGGRSRPAAPKKNEALLRSFFIHCESNGISSRFSVYLITEGVYHQPQAVSAFAMMIYNTSC